MDSVGKKVRSLKTELQAPGQGDHSCFSTLPLVDDAISHNPIYTAFEFLMIGVFLIFQIGYYCCT